MSLTAAQIELRSRGIGASEIAALVGEDPYKSPLDLWLTKTGRQKDQPSIQTEWGHRIEPIVADAFAARHGVTLRESGTLVHGELPWALATPDRVIVGRRECLEAKNVGYRMMGRWRFGDGYRAPLYVQLQGQWQCFVGGFDRFHVAALLGGRDEYDECFTFDAELAGQLADIAARFWRDHVLADRQPPPGPTEKDREILARLHPVAGKILRPSTPDLDALAREYHAAREAEKAAGARKHEAQARLQQAIGDDLGIVGTWGEATWSPKGGPIAWAKVAKEAGVTEELIAKHTGKPGRKFTLKYGDDDGDE